MIYLYSSYICQKCFSFTCTLRRSDSVCRCAFAVETLRVTHVSNGNDFTMSASTSTALCCSQRSNKSLWTTDGTTRGVITQYMHTHCVAERRLQHSALLRLCTIYSLNYNSPILPVFFAELGELFQTTLRPALKIISNSAALFDKLWK